MYNVTLFKLKRAVHLAMNFLFYIYSGLEGPTTDTNGHF